jgi:hypothetical protein
VYGNNCLGENSDVKSDKLIIELVTFYDEGLPLTLGDGTKEAEIGPICSVLGKQLCNSASEDETGKSGLDRKLLLKWIFRKRGDLAS